MPPSGEILPEPGAEPAQTMVLCGLPGVRPPPRRTVTPPGATRRT